jgi:hypothetical protein
VAVVGYINGYVLQIDGVSISGLAPDLSAAAAQFRAAYKRNEIEAGLPEPEQ